MSGMAGKGRKGRKCKGKAKSKAPSAGAQVVAEELESLKVAVSREVKFDDCRDVKCLPFDFLFSAAGRTAVVEFDGEQHFTPSSLYHRNPGAFAKEQAHDRAKTAYAANHGIFMLRLGFDLTHAELRAQVRGFVSAVERGGRARTFLVARDPALYDYLRPQGRGRCALL